MHKQVRKKKQRGKQTSIWQQQEKKANHPPTALQRYRQHSAELTNCEADPLAARARLKKTRALLDTFLCPDWENMSLPS